MIAQFHDVQPIERDMAEIAFASNNPIKICDTLVRVTFYENDYQWVQNKCLELITSEDLDVKRLAITCLGHLARIHNKIDKMLVIPLLQKLREDKCLEGVVEDALDDIEMFAS